SRTVVGRGAEPQPSPIETRGLEYWGITTFLGRPTKGGQAPPECEWVIMNVLLLMTQPVDSGPVERIAMTFGLNLPQLLRHITIFCSVCSILYLFAYLPSLKILDMRRQQTDQGLANAEQIKAELAKTEAQRQEVMARANTQADKLIEEARAAAA